MSEQFLTIAGRWKHHVTASGLDKALPRKELGLAMLMYYAGFSAALDATQEVASFEEADAVQLLQALLKEVRQVEAMATRLGTGAMSQ